MNSGTIRVESKTGAYLGCDMLNGTLEVNGDAGDACGCAMRGGQG
jgi:formylmethanofuran dehydrogenase subunit C